MPVPNVNVAVGKLIPSASALWPNDPYSLGVSGWVLINDYGFTDALPDGSVNGQQLGTSGWLNDYGTSITGGGLSQITDATAPNIGTPGWTSTVLRSFYPAGFAGGVAPFTLYRASNFNYSKVFLGFWFKHSSNWVSEPIGKMCELFDNGSGGSYFYEANGGSVANVPVFPYFPVEPSGGGPYDMSCNLDPSFTVALGSWHRAEGLWQFTGTDQGSFDAWCDGTHVAAYTGQVFGGTAFNNAQIYPDWGGGGNNVPADQSWDIAHIYLSGHA